MTQVYAPHIAVVHVRGQSCGHAHMKHQHEISMSPGPAGSPGHPAPDHARRRLRMGAAGPGDQVGQAQGGHGLHDRGAARHSTSLHRQPQRQHPRVVP